MVSLPQHAATLLEVMDGLLALQHSIAPLVAKIKVESGVLFADWDIEAQ